MTIYIYIYTPISVSIYWLNPLTYTYIQMIYISVDHPFSDQLLSLPTCHFWSTSRWTSSWKSESVDLWRCGTPASRYQRRRLGGKKVYDGMMKHSALVNISEYYWILVNVDMTMIYSLSTDKYRIQWLSSLSQFLPTQLWKSHDILVNHLVKISWIQHVAIILSLEHWESLASLNSAPHGCQTSYWKRWSYFWWFPFKMSKTDERPTWSKLIRFGSMINYN